MAKEIESVSTALFDKVRSRFDNVTLGDENAKACTDPSKARFFNFTYTDETGAKFGKVTISLIDETSLKVYFGQNISGEMDREQRHDWYDFLRGLRKFAKRNLLTFDTRDINKSNLNLQDVKQQAKSDDVSTTNDIKVTESKLYGTSRNSYADMGECKLVIKHDGLVSDEKHGDRSRRIRDIFIETNRGERLLVPFKNLDGARALAQHISHGGTMYDECAEHITDLVNEMSAMRHFVRSTKHRQFEDQETADMTRAAVHHYDQVKRKLRQMRGARGYRSYFESWTPESAVEETVDVDALKERFVKKIYDERFNDALPIVYREYVKQKNNVSTELEEWADEITENVWTSSHSEQDQIDACIEMLSKPKPVGIDGIDGSALLDKLVPIIGPDIKNDLDSQMNDLFIQHGPDADVAGLIKEWLGQNRPDIYSQVQQKQEPTLRNSQTNFATPTSPVEPHGKEYGDDRAVDKSGAGATGWNIAYEDSKDPLDFIRSLAGIRK
jgi:hypothetical protein